MTDAIRKNPYSIVLFDEIEKAHPDVFNLLLQILDDGRLTDSKGRVVSFRNAILVMTSNAGAQIAQSGGMGFGGAGASGNYEQMKEKLLTNVKRVFKPEFLNRVDDLIVFHKLSMEDTKQICRLILNEFCDRLNEKGIQLTYGDDVVDFFSAEGFDEQYGARPLRRLIQRRLEDTLAEKILAEELIAPATVNISADGQNLKYTIG